MSAGTHDLCDIRDRNPDIYRLDIGAGHHDVIDRYMADAEDIAEQREFLRVVAIVFKLDQLFNGVAQIVGIAAAARQRSP